MVKIVADECIPFVSEYFSKLGELVLLPGRQIKATDVADAEILLVRSITKVDAALLKHSTVRFVGTVTAGFDHLDIEWLEKNNIAYTSLPGFNAPPVANYVIGVLAALQRRQLFPQYHGRVAVIGVGATGSLVANALKAIGVDVVLCDPLRAKLESDFKHCYLNAIDNVDAISLHVPLVKEGFYPTDGFIDKAFLQRQKPNAVLINASRGAVLNEEDILSTFKGQLCLDVYKGEPTISLPLFTRAVIATPHIAGYSVQAKLRGITSLYNHMREKNILPAMPDIVKELPRQTLSFAGRAPHWQDVLLGIFNPLLMTNMMHTLMQDEATRSEAFDRMRDTFNYRHEFAFTNVECDTLLSEDREVLQALGVGCGD